MPSKLLGEEPPNRAVLAEVLAYLKSDIKVLVGVIDSIEKIH